MKFLIGLAATAMSALLLAPTLSPAELHDGQRTTNVAQISTDARSVRA